MPGTFLTQTERNQLSTFPAVIPNWDLVTAFAISAADRRFLDQYRTDANRLGVALQLCTLRYLGFCPAPLDDAPGEVIAHLAEQLDVTPSVLHAYGTRRMTRSAHFQAVLDYLDFRRPHPVDPERWLVWLTERALEHDKPTLLLQLLGEELKRRQIVRPGVTVLERLVMTARTQAHEESFRRLAPMLTAERIALLDSLLVPEQETSKTLLTQFRQQATTNTPAAMLEALAKLTLLQRWWVEQWDVSALNPNRQKFLTRLGRKYTAQALRRMGPERRYPILLAFLKQTLSDLTDEIIDIYDVCLATRHKKAKEALETYQQQVADTTDAHSQLLHTVGRLVLDESISNPRLRTAIYGQIPREHLQEAVEEARTLRRPHDHLDFLTDHYSYLRQFVPQFLTQMPFTSHQTRDPLLAAIEVIRALDTTNQRQLPAKPPLGFVPPRWRRFVLAQKPPARRAYEVCVLSTLRDALRAGNIYLPTSRRYADPETYLIPQTDWPRVRAEVGRQLDQEPTGTERLNRRAQDLQTLLPRLDRELTRSEGIRIEQGELIVPADAGQEPPDSAKALEEQVSRRLPSVELTDLLLEVDSWTGFSQQLTHASGGQPRTDELSCHLYATLLAQGTNMGLTEMAHSAGLTYERLAWCSNWYLREETLKSAVATLVNYQARQPLAHRWGGGTLSSSDGQRFPVRGKMRNATALPRYFGYGQGITFYTWTSDQFSQYGTKVISSTVRDATYVLDEILDNETELSIVEHTTDTAGYTDLVFALFDLLGMQFSPRIRDLGDRRLYRLKHDTTRYPTLDVRLTGRIDVARLAQHWDKFLRVAGSLKQGHVTASLLVSRLQAYPRQNQLTKLLQEYGRLIKTIFMLRYLEDEAFRRRIHTQLNKGERLHQLRKFLFFVWDGVITQKYAEEQVNQAGCLNVLTNAVIVWNTVYLQAALEALRHEGFPVRDEDLVHLSPTRFAHIHRYGKYVFDMEAARRRAGLRPLRP
jgi:TnpA family transposase